MASSDQNLNKFRKELEKQIPGISFTVKDLNEQLQQIPFASKDSPLEETVESILKLARKV